MSKQDEIKTAVKELIRGNNHTIAADFEHIPLFLAEFKKEKYNIRITFHKDIESEYYYIHPDTTPALHYKLDKIQEALG